MTAAEEVVRAARAEVALAWERPPSGPGSRASSAEARRRARLRPLPGEAPPPGSRGSGGAPAAPPSPPAAGADGRAGEGPGSRGAPAGPPPAGGAAGGPLGRRLLRASSRPPSEEAGDESSGSGFDLEAVDVDEGRGLARRRGDAAGPPALLDVDAQVELEGLEERLEERMAALREARLRRTSLAVRLQDSERRAGELGEAVARLGLMLAGAEREAWDAGPATPEPHLELRRGGTAPGARPVQDLVDAWSQDLRAAMGLPPAPACPADGPAAEPRAAS